VVVIRLKQSCSPRLVKSEVRHVSFDGFYLLHKDVPISGSLLCLLRDLPFYVLMKEGIREKERASALSIDMVTFMIEVRGSMRGHDLIYRWDYH